jgi:hypothetical protein
MPCLTRGKACITLAAGPRHRKLSSVWFPRVTWPHFTLSILRILQLGGPVFCIYFPKAQDNPVTSPRIGLAFNMTWL